MRARQKLSDDLQKNFEGLCAFLSSTRLHFYPKGVYQKVYKNHILLVYRYISELRYTKSILFLYTFWYTPWDKSGGELMKEKHINPQNFSTSHQITFDSEAS